MSLLLTVEMILLFAVKVDLLLSFIHPSVCLHESILVGYSVYPSVYYMRVCWLVTVFNPECVYMRICWVVTVFTPVYLACFKTQRTVVENAKVP